MRQQIRDMDKEIAGYVRRAIERITDLGAMALDAQVVPGAAADGKDVLRIHYFNPSTVRPPRPWRVMDEFLGQLPEFAEVLEIGSGDLPARPGGALVTEVTAVRRGGGRRTASASRTSVGRIGGIPDGVIVDRVVELNREPTGPPPADWKCPRPRPLLASTPMTASPS